MIDRAYFKPQASLTFKTVGAVRSELFQALMAEKTDAFCIDLSDINYCDSAGLALLIEARKLCNQQHKHLEVIGMSSETRSLAEFCGVQSIF